MLVNVARTLGSLSAWDHNNGSAFFQPVYKAVAVISLVCDNIFTPQIKRFQQLLRITNVITVPWCQQNPQWVSQSIHYRVDFRAQSSPTASQCFVAPFFAPMPCWWTLMVVLSSIRVLPSTMFWAISSSKICSQTPCRLHRRNRVYTFPRAIPLRQIPPRYSCIQPIQDSIEHYPIVFSGSSAMCRLFWRQQLFHLIPLFFCQFMSFHAFTLLLLP